MKPIRYIVGAISFLLVWGMLSACIGCLAISRAAAEEAMPATNYVEVFREINDHPRVAFTNGMTILDAINASGGYGPFASSDVVRVIPSGGGFVELKRHDIDARNTNIYTLHTGDTILVVEGNYIDVAGKVRHPTRLFFTNGMTVLDAINAAGGYDPKFSPTTIIVYGVSYSNLITLNRRDVDHRKKNPFTLHEYDAVFVMVGKTMEEDQQLEQARALSKLEALRVSKSRMFLYTLDFARGDATNTNQSFHDYTVLGNAELAADDGKTLWTAFVKGARESDGTVASCFNPRHGLRIVRGSVTNDFVICFECQAVNAYDFNDSFGFPINPLPLIEFNALANKYHLKLNEK